DMIFHFTYMIFITTLRFTMNSFISYFYFNITILAHKVKLHKLAQTKTEYSWFIRLFRLNFEAY
ncbi:hypothetical protein ACJX0J_033804, partial [Zea mays]